MTRIDLHAHTNHSDGTFTPTELIEEANAIGLSLIAVTDHDTTSGLEEARKAGERLGVEIVDGCEITTTLPTGIVHVLSYAFDVDDVPFQDLLAKVRTLRHERNLGILERLQELKLPLTYEDVAEHAYGQVVARPHFAQAMVAHNYVADLREAFKHYLYDGGPAFVRAKAPRPEVAIRAVKQAGGVCVLAHPKQMKLASMDAYRAAVGSMKDAGLDGIEVAHPSHDQTQRARFAELAKELELVPSGGSDFHGAAKPHIALGKGDGTIEVHRETWDRLSARRRVA